MTTEKIVAETAEVTFTADSETRVTIEYSEDYEEPFYEGFTHGDKVPISIFSQGLSPLQAIVLYLKEQGNNFSQIGRLLNRDPRTIWSTYDKVSSHTLEIERGKIIPLNIFTDRKLSTLECLVEYLLDLHSISETAELLDKNYQTVWTVKRRIKKKRGGSE